MNLTHTSALILQAVASGYRYGFDVIGVTGLPSGTVYPALRRLEDARFVRSRWESEEVAHRQNRPPRKYYQVLAAGERSLAEARRRFRHLEAIRPASALSPEPRASES